jgi:hypothetical protein
MNAEAYRRRPVTPTGPIFVLILSSITPASASSRNRQAHDPAIELPGWIDRHAQVR